MEVKKGMFIACFGVMVVKKMIGMMVNETSVWVQSVQYTQLGSHLYEVLLSTSDFVHP